MKAQRTRRLTCLLLLLAHRRAYACSFLVETKKKAGTRRAAPRVTTCVCCQTPHANVAASRDLLSPAPRREVFHSRVRIAGGVRGFGSKPPRCVFPTVMAHRGLLRRRDTVRLGSETGDGPVSSLPRAAFPRDGFLRKHRHSRSIASLSHRVRTLRPRLAFVRNDTRSIPSHRRGRIGKRQFSHCGGASAWFCAVLSWQRARLSPGLKALYPRLAQ